MSVLPDEIWSRILEMGVETKGLSYRDMCCISITCRRFHRLSNDHPLWATLLALDFPSPSLSLPSNNASNIQTTPKSLYKIRFERDRAAKLLAHRRAVLVVESQIAICSRNLRDFGLQLLREKDKMKETVEELAHLRMVRWKLFGAGKSKLLSNVEYLLSTVLVLWRWNLNFARIRLICFTSHMTPEEVFAAKGVKPTLFPNLNALALVEAAGVKRHLFCGVGCQVQEE